MVPWMCPHWGRGEVIEVRMDRLQVTVSPAMLAAITILAERNGVPRSTQAMISLRQALQRTMDTDECKARIAAGRPMMTARERMHWMQIERLVEGEYEQAKAKENADDDDQLRSAKTPRR